MDFEQALVQELKAITALGNRIYPLFAPEAVKKNGVPYLIYASSEGIRENSLGGFLDCKEVRGELNIIADRYSDLKAITKQVIAILISFQGRRIGTDGPLIEEISYLMPVEMYEQDAALHRCVVEFQAYFKG